ncbi:MAG: type II toxin-antitoxin system Phd/YefM family antitoxin [Austwickia sp.]|jgi:antitoxin YefM|nr:MAG: type II toxin-antitoxin system Phd/YefM family antitoxin [Austwickia sp.]
MRSVSLSEAKDKLSGLIDDVDETHEIVTITRHGRPAAVLMSADDLESLHETMYWLSRPGLRESLAEAERAVSLGETMSSEELRRDLGLPAAP